MIDDFRGADAEGCKYTIESMGLECVIRGDGAVVTDQMPRVGSVVSEGGRVVSVYRRL